MPYPMSAVRGRSFQSAVVAFSPLSIASLKLWLDFSDLSTLYRFADGTVPVANDLDVFGYVADKSGNCLVGDTRAFFGSGYQKVSEVNGSDTIYQTDGKFGDIRHFWSRDYDGEVIRIKARGMQKIGITPEHLVCAVAGEQINSLRQAKRANGQSIPTDELKSDWVAAKNVRVGDLLLVAKPELESREVILKFESVNRQFEKQKVFADFEKGLVPSEIETKYSLSPQSLERYYAYYLKGESNPVHNIANTEQILDEEWAELFGWWVAEGSIGLNNSKVPDKIQFSLCDDERDTANRLVYLLKSKANISAHTQVRDGHSLVVVTSSVSLAKFLADNFGLGARNKKLPEWLLNAESKVIKSFLRAYISGDGCVMADARGGRGDFADVATSSPRLVSGISLLLMKIGILPKINKSNSEGEKTFSVSSAPGKDKIIHQSDGWGLRLSSRDTKEIFDDANLCGFGATRETYLQDDKYFYIRVSSVETEQYSGKVYDFETDTHTLGLPFVVHNSNHATQATTASKPLWRAAVQNGRGVGRWDGVDDWLRTGLFSTPQPTTIFVVAKPNGLATAQFSFVDDIGANNRNLLYKKNTTGNFSLFAGTEIQSSITTVGEFTLLSAVFSGANSLLYRNALLIASGNPGTQNLDGVTIGANITNVSSAGDISEILIYDSALSTADRISVESYLKAKWGTP